MLWTEPSQGNTVKRYYAWLLLIPMLLVLLGAASNQAVLIANHGKFPVMLNEQQVSDFIDKQNRDEDRLAKKPEEGTNKFTIENTSVSKNELKHGQFLDSVHSVMGPNSRLKAMADIFDLGNIYSIGDFLIIVGEFFWPYLALLFLGLNALKFPGLKHVAYGLFGLLALKGTIEIVDAFTLAIVLVLAVASGLGYATYRLGKALSEVGIGD